VPRACQRQIHRRFCFANAAALRKMPVLFAAFLCCGVSYAQQPPAGYRETVLAIQNHIESGDLEGARRILSGAMRAYPSNGGLENLLGIVEVQQGNHDEARQSFSEAIRHSPKLLSAYLNLGRLDLETAAGDLARQAEALRVYESALQIDPHNSEANYEAAAILTRTGKYQESLNHLARLGADEHAKVAVQILVCADEAALGRRAEADKSAEALAADQELTEQDVAVMLPALKAARRADLIEKFLIASEARHPLSASSLRTLGLAQEADGKLVLARATLERAFSADPTSIVPLIDLARVAQESKDNMGALGYLAHARDLRPEDASLSFQFGMICAQMNLFTESEKALTEAVKLAPDNPLYNLDLGIVISYDHDPTQALPYLQKFNVLRSDDPAGYLAIGTAYFRSKDYDNAGPWLARAAGREKTAASANYYLARIAREKGMLDEAVADLTKSDKLKPDQPEVLAELGQIHVQQRKYDEARAELTQALQIDADNYAANFGLLQLYVRTGDPRRAEQTKRFEAVKDQGEQESHEMLRVIEVDRHAP